VNRPIERSDLLDMRMRDPDVTWDREPTDNDHKRFQTWVIATYGIEGWDKYQTNWDQPRSLYE